MIISSSCWDKTNMIFIKLSICMPNHLHVEGEPKIIKMGVRVWSGKGGVWPILGYQKLVSKQNGHALQ